MVYKMRIVLFLSLALASSSFAQAVNLSGMEVPKIANHKAQYHQTCGKAIDVEIFNINNLVVIGLRNHKTGALDLFTSAKFSENNKQFEEYIPVRYDNISKTIIKIDDGRPDVGWGSQYSEEKGEYYSLTLGEHTHDCGQAHQWMSEKAEEYYEEE